MQKRSLSMVVVAALTGVMLVIALGVVVPASGSPRAQGNPTEQQQTIDAIVQMRFTQTAEVEQSLALTQTMQAATVLAPTLTAAFNATVDAAFNEALTATAAAGVNATVDTQRAQWGWELDALARRAAAKETAIQEWLATSGRSLDTVIQQNDLLALSAAAQADALTAAAAQYGFTDLALFGRDGVRIAPPSPASGVLTFAPDGSASLLQGAFLDEAHGGIPSLVVSRPLDAAGDTLLVGWPDLSALDTILTEPDPSGWPVSAYLVFAGTGRVVAPTNLPEGSAPASDAINQAFSMQNGTGVFASAGGQVLAAYRWEATLQSALVIEIPATAAANLPTPTASPVPPPPSPYPEIFPTNVTAEVQMVEQGYEHGRMFWLRHNRQIWVMVDVPPDNPAGDWYCYNDIFVEGEPEIDPSLIPPDGLYQPRRGFGTLWRSHPELKAGLGWATTPEFELTSQYTYIAGGYVQDSQYIPGPGEHRLTTLDNQTIAFFEREIRGDCLGGTWRLSQ